MDSKSRFNQEADIIQLEQSRRRKVRKIFPCSADRQSRLASQLTLAVTSIEYGNNNLRLAENVNRVLSLSGRLRMLNGTNSENGRVLIYFSVTLLAHVKR